MDSTKTDFPLSIGVAQIAWVVKDIKATKQFMEDVMGIRNFSAIVTTHAQDFDGTYYGKPSNAKNLTAQAFSGGAFIELIQPISENNIFQDYLKDNPSGGIQHIAYRIPVAELDKRISEFEHKGFPVVSTFDTSIAKIVFFDTRKEIGVFTEVMGITKEGEAIIQKMESATA